MDNYQEYESRGGLGNYGPMPPQAQFHSPASTNQQYPPQVPETQPSWYTYPGGLHNHQLGYNHHGRSSPDHPYGPFYHRQLAATPQYASPGTAGSPLLQQILVATRPGDHPSPPPQYHHHQQQYIQQSLPPPNVYPVPRPSWHTPVSTGSSTQASVQCLAPPSRAIRATMNSPSEWNIVEQKYDTAGSLAIDQSTAVTGDLPEHEVMLKFEPVDDEPTQLSCFTLKTDVASEDDDFASDDQHNQSAGSLITCHPSPLTPMLVPLPLWLTGTAAPSPAESSDTEVVSDWSTSAPTSPGYRGYSPSHDQYNPQIPPAHYLPEPQLNRCAYSGEPHRHQPGYNYHGWCSLFHPYGPFRHRQLQVIPSYATAGAARGPLQQQMLMATRPGDHPSPPPQHHHHQQQQEEQQYIQQSLPSPNVYPVPRPSWHTPVFTGSSTQASVQCLAPPSRAIRAAINSPSEWNIVEHKCVTAGSLAIGQSTAITGDLPEHEVMLKFEPVDDEPTQQTCFTLKTDVTSEDDDSASDDQHNQSAASLITCRPSHVQQTLNPMLVPLLSWLTGTAAPSTTESSDTEVVSDWSTSAPTLPGYRGYSPSHDQYNPQIPPAHYLPEPQLNRCAYLGGLHRPHPGYNHHGRSLLFHPYAPSRHRQLHAALPYAPAGATSGPPMYQYQQEYHGPSPTANFEHHHHRQRFLHQRQQQWRSSPPPDAYPVPQPMYYAPASFSNPAQY